MPDQFNQLLDATIQHLEDLKAHGERFVLIQPETLAALARPSPRRPMAPNREADVQPVRESPSHPLVPEAASQAAPTLSVAPEHEGASGAGATDKAKALAELCERAVACTRCPNLVEFRKQVVFGVGNPNADLMFVGEAPGADEDAQGEPFVGRAGQLLTKIIETMGLSRDQVYIGNVLKCRPDIPKGTPGNRKPTPEEMETCIPWLMDQIEIIQPKVLVGLGATAIEGLLGKVGGITRLRGNWKDFRGIPLMPTFHPSYLLRPENAPKKRLVWEDMLQVMERLGLPISDKQRGFFLKK